MIFRVICAMEVIHVHFFDTFLSRNFVSGKLFHLSMTRFGLFKLVLYSLTVIFTGFWAFRGWKILFYFNNELSFEIIQSDFIVFLSRMFSSWYFSHGLFNDTGSNWVYKTEVAFCSPILTYFPFNCFLPALWATLCQRLCCTTLCEVRLRFLHAASRQLRPYK